MGRGVRWWDGDRWCDDVRAEHPRGVQAGASAPPPVPPPDPGGSDLVGRSRLVVAQLRPRSIGGPAYAYYDGDGVLIGTMVERPPVDGRHPGERAATLDLYDEDGGEVLRLTRDPHLVDQTCATFGWPPLRPWGYVVVGPDLAPVAWVRAETWSHKPWLVHCLGIDVPIELRRQRIGTGRKAPRPVLMGGVPVGQITLVSGWNASDTYVLDLFHGPPEGGLATVLAALVPMYDQIFREVTPPSTSSGISDI
ncbi:hypothetical protein HC251_16275 [Iamia sp. SCSIO 61187]|uniref:hypothetical protein n=1 Tax=Iamia sp. SCSIO 61187 TaxID=2722752 RepID=UPI001C62FD5D|nr:hypothetical protein [Iamia sp. SCSIO 61187]QYG93828.1 hypothetical protein HC251_16275 [Iamia sp. SCSIO 61187]